jgi:hypothetical protein
MYELTFFFVNTILDGGVFYQSTLPAILPIIILLVIKYGLILLKEGKSIHRNAGSTISQKFSFFFF